MSEHLLFLTGRLALPRLGKVLAAMQPTPFTFDVQDIGVKVAALMTPDIIRRRLPQPTAGRSRHSARALARRSGGADAAVSACPLAAAPMISKTCRSIFGRQGKPVDLSRHDVRIFAEIVEAPSLDVAGILAPRRCLSHRRRRRDRSRLSARHALSPSGRLRSRAARRWLQDQRRFRRSGASFGVAGRPAPISS